MVSIFVKIKFFKLIVLTLKSIKQLYIQLSQKKKNTVTHTNT